MAPVIVHQRAGKANVTAASPPPLEGVRVLVVEDEEDARDLMSTILARAGAEVNAVGRVDEALETIPSWGPHVIVSDLLMPDSDGFDLVSAIRKRSLDVRTIAVSGLTAPSDVARAVSSGFDVHLKKPLDTKELVETIHELVAPSSR